MQKKRLVLAVGLAFCAHAALAATKIEAGGDEDANPITLYGKLYPELNTARGSGATPVGTPVATFVGAPTGGTGIINRLEMNGSNTHFGIRGSEKIMPGVRAIFQMETEFRVDQNGTGWAARDSFVGAATGWGTIRLGRMDTPFKKWGDTLGFLGISSGNIVSTSELLRKAGFGGNSASSFHLRRSNAVDYATPVIGGFQAALQYSTDEARTATRNPEDWSGGIRYDRGPIYIALNHEKHKDMFGGSRNVPSAMSNFNDQSVRSDDKATQFEVEVRLGNHKFEADYIRKEYKENPSVTGRFVSYKNNAWMVVYDGHLSQNWRVAAHYIKAEKGSCARVNASCNTEGLGGSQTSLGVAYYFSRRTYLFMFVQWLKNDFSAQFNSAPVQAPNIGEDLTQYALGLAHTF